MKIKKYFIIPAIALLAVSCQDDDINNGGNDSNAAGKEVTFGATLGESTLTRTSYGSYDEDNNEYPIYWVEGDKVIVTSPDCGAESANGGVGSATYSVSVNNATQNYATSLTKTGDIGVRWGENSTGTFYSVYPADNASFDADYTTVTLTMPQQQDCDVASDDNTVTPDMDACFMYAKTSDVASGSTVNLKYIPISTAIRFNLTGPSTGDDVRVTDINFYAPDDTAISGKFSVNLENADGESVPTLSRVNGQWYNYVSLNAAYESSSGYVTLSIGEKVEMNVFLLLEGETTVGDGWSIEIKTSNGTTYTKNLSLSSESGNTLKPGMVHKLPDLPALDNETEWKASNWMANLPRNVYLSEISIPGSWNSLNTDFQGSNTSIQAQYNAGARAFHIDTRWRSTRSISLTGYVSSSTIDGTLAVANGGTSYQVTGSGGLRIMSSSAPSFESILSTITGCVRSDEYMVVYCTFAQDSYDYTSTGGWEKAISDVCANNTAVIDARDLNENSVVADVLGSVIVIINTDETVTDLGLSDSRCLFMTDMGMELDQSTYTSEDYTVTTLANGSGSTCVNAYGTHAQITARETYTTGYMSDSRGYAPSLTERRTKAGNILSWSQTNHQSENYDHDTWLYLGLGGYMVNSGGDSAVSDSYDTVASNLNGWINTQVTNMESNDSFYPVGIVLMNYVTDYSTVMENILKLNNTYRKAYDGNRSSVDGSYLDGSGTTTTSVHSVATGYSSGMTDNNTNVISWD